MGVTLSPWFLFLVLSIKSRSETLSASGQQRLEDIAMDIGETVVAALETIRQSGVIEAEQMQPSGLHIVHVHRILYN
jgi:hypothetical protein